jgi:hypothetical protein
VGELLAGVGRSKITPPLGIFLCGYAARDRGAEAVHDDLYATALVLDDGHTRIAIVTCDLLFLHPAMVADIRARVLAETGIPGRNLMLCCSHTHSGPVTYALEGGKAYLDQLPEWIVAAVVQAEHRLRRAAWGVGRGKVEIGVNRRQRLANGQVTIGANPEGAVDRDLLVLRVDCIDRVGARGTLPLALLVNCACHAVCLSANSYAISADWPGVMRQAVEARTGAAVGFIQGACADTNPIGGPQDDFDAAQRLGEAVAERALAVFEGIVLQREVRLGATHRGIGLPLLGPTGRDGNPVPPFDELLARIVGQPPDTARALLDRRFPWRAHIEERDDVWYTVAECQALALSDVVLVGLAAEPFAEIGQQVKARSSAALTLFAGYANGCVGYLPTPLAYDQGGYEVDSAYIYYRLPAPLAPACADLAMGGALALIDALEPLL